MDLSFYKMCPSGNTTILISNPHIAAPLRAPIANMLMHPLHLQAEQVAYVDMHAKPPHITMMGGEFCGNACRSLAAILAMELKTQGSQDGKNFEGSMLSSGTDAPVAYRVYQADDGTMNAAIRMPNATMPAVSYVKINNKNAPIVHLDGIDHLLLDETDHPQSAEHNTAQASTAAREILDQCGLLQSVAAGCIWYQHDIATGACSITPFVHVRETQSLYAETACGSGTLAMALYLAGMTQGATPQNESTVTLHVLQPSGMTITATCTQHASPNRNAPHAEAHIEAHIEAWIGGEVTCIAKGLTMVNI